jgi:DNA-binding XRE family transcriptional regulator
LSESALAKTVGISEENLKAIEENHRGVKRTERRSFARALGVPVEELMK